MPATPTAKQGNPDSMPGAQTLRMAAVQAAPVLMERAATVEKTCWVIARAVHTWPHTMIQEEQKT